MAQSNSRDHRSSQDHPLLESVGLWWRDYRKRQRAQAELQAMSVDDLDRMAQDIGVTPADLRDLATRSAQAADEAPQMMAALGLDVEALRRSEPHVLRDIEIACTRCGQKGRCGSELADGTAAAHVDEFCVNAETFHALQAIRAAT